MAFDINRAMYFHLVYPTLCTKKKIIFVIKIYTLSQFENDENYEYLLHNLVELTNFGITLKQWLVQQHFSKNAAN